jgi:hypothetical protein
MVCRGALTLDHTSYFYKRSSHITREDYTNDERTISCDMLTCKDKSTANVRRKVPKKAQDLHSNHQGPGKLTNREGTRSVSVTHEPQDDPY